MVDACLNKHYRAALKDYDSGSGHAQVAVLDGLHRVNIVQVVRLKPDGYHHSRTFYQCPCEQFHKEQLNYCEHVALVELISEHGEKFDGGFSFCRELNRQLKVYSSVPMVMKVYDSDNQKIIKLSRGTKKQIKEIVDNNQVVESFALKTYRDKINLDSVIFETTTVNNFTIKSEGLLLDNIKLYDYQETIFSGMVKEKKAICSMKMRFSVKL